MSLGFLKFNHHQFISDHGEERSEAERQQDGPVELLGQHPQRWSLPHPVDELCHWQRSGKK